MPAVTSAGGRREEGVLEEVISGSPEKVVRVIKLGRWGKIGRGAKGHG